MSAGPVSVLGSCKHEHHLGADLVCQDMAPQHKQVFLLGAVRGGHLEGNAKPSGLTWEEDGTVFQTPAFYPDTELPPQEASAGEVGGACG